MLIELRLSSAYKPLRVQTLAKSLAAFGDSCYFNKSNVIKLSIVYLRLKTFSFIKKIFFYHN